jgi:hypothetical protein
MTTTNFLVPPPELVQKWWDNVPGTFTSLVDETELATQAARWGADQELEECCEWLDTGLMTPYVSIRLRSARRPKPPSLKEQALAVLMALEIDEPGYEGTYNTIRRALEALPND